MSPSEWKGSIYRVAGRPTLRVKVWDGAWRTRATPYLDTPEGWTAARRLLAELRSELQARHAAMGGEAGPVTVRAWSKRWLSRRGHSHDDDQSHLEHHVLPVIGDRILAEVEPRHILAMVRGWKGAPRSIRNRYSTVRGLFRDAAVEGLRRDTPCILAGGVHLPVVEDADSEWRSGAVFTRREVERLLSKADEIEADSRVLYHLLALGALRHGEAAALRWRHYDPGAEPLGRLVIANSNRRRRTKAGRTRWMPVLPELAAVLAAWRLAGWAQLVGRPPGDDDLVLPLPAAGLRKHHLPPGEDSRMRTRQHTWKRLVRHMEALGLRHRRVHDLRRTFLTLAEAAGADRAVLGWGTHGRPGDVLGAYTEPDWERLCGEAAKLSGLRGTTHGTAVVPVGTPKGHRIAQPPGARGAKGHRRATRRGQ